MFGQLKDEDIKRPLQNASQAIQEDDEEDVPIEVPEYLDTILDVLLQQIQCQVGSISSLFPSSFVQSTVVRWTAAKAIGRSVQHLPFEFGDQVVESVIELLETSKTNRTLQDEGGCHGACLTIAELSRRGTSISFSFSLISSGCLLPNRLERLIPPLCRVRISNR